MEILKRLLHEISNKTFDVGTSHWVNVVHIVNPHKFYVRPRSYDRYLPYLLKRTHNADAPEIKIGDIYIYKSEVTKNYTRGEVLFCEKINEETKYKMFAIDIGYIEEGVPLKSIWKKCYSLQVPPLATRCHLADCSPLGEGWDDDAIEAMKSFIGMERAKIVIRSKTSTEIFVDMYNTNPDDIATMLALTEFSTFGFPSNITKSNSLLTMRNYSQRALNVGEILHVRIQSGDTNDKFYVSTIEDYKSYLVERCNYFSYARSLKEMSKEDIVLNAPIGVLYHRNNKFERALVKELIPESNRAKVQLVDWGNIIEESISKMKPIQEWYLRVPVKALYCTLHSSQRHSNVPLSLPGVEYWMTVKEVGDINSMRPNVVTLSC